MYADGVRTADGTRSSLTLWIAELTASLLLSAWLYLWCQWRFPVEDEPLLFVTPLAFAAGGALFAFAVDCRRSRMARVWLCAPAVPLILAFGAVLDELWAEISAASIPIEAKLLNTIFWGAFCIASLGAFLLACVTVRAQPERPHAERRLRLACSMAPILIVVSLCALPLLDSYKWLWPWIAFRPTLLELQTNAANGAKRLGIQPGHWLTEDERRRLSAETPLEMTFRYPIIGGRVGARINMIGEDVTVSWGHHTFGPINPRTMKIRNASD